MKRFLRILFGVNLMVSLLSLLSYLSPYIEPAQSWIFSAIAIFNPFYILIHILFIVFWIGLKKKYAILSVAVLLIGWSHLSGIYSFNLKQTNQDGFSLLSYNFQNSSYVQSGEKETREEKTEEYQKFLNSLGSSDILCAYELSYRSIQFIKKHFDFEYEASFENKSVGIYTRYPVVDQGLIDFGNRSNNCLWADLDIDGDTIRVYAVHFESSRVSVDAEKVLDGGDLQEKETWKSVRDIFGKYGHHSKNRSKQAQELNNHKAMSPYPVILCGDFNETPLSHLYRKLCTNMQDSFRKKGSGYGATYAGSIPGLRIDYILADLDFEISNHEIIRKNFSDHYPIKSIIKLKRR